MKRRDFMAGAVLWGAFQSPAQAGDLAAAIVRRLTKQGFVDVVQERTLLGRIRITATRNGGFREIIFNPNTDEILRDLWQRGPDEEEDIDLINEDFEEAEDVKDDKDEDKDDDKGEDGSDGDGDGDGGGDDGVD